MTALDADSGVKLRAILALPPGDVRLFMVASIKGSWVPVSGRPGPLHGGERGVATELRPQQRDQVLELVGLSIKSWQHAVARWADLRLAHRCRPGWVTLFYTPLNGDAAMCPRCRAELGVSRHTGLDSPATRDNVSRHTGQALDGIAAASSANAPDAVKVNQQGEEEGGTLVAEEDELTILAREREEAEEAAALANLRRILKAREASA